MQMPDMLIPLSRLCLPTLGLKSSNGITTLYASSCATPSAKELVAALPMFSNYRLTDGKTSFTQFRCCLCQKLLPLQHGMFNSLRYH